MPEQLTIPPELSGLELVLSISGGKDSVATGLAMREAEIEYRSVFADTGWESAITYEYLDYLESEAGFAVDRVSKPGGMVGQIERDSYFPGRLTRWCTPQLKIKPLRIYHDQLIEETGKDTAAVLGIRHAEGTASNGRGDVPEVTWDDRWDGYLWHPIRRWTIEDVVAIHHRHGVKLNPLYEQGLNRVGCWPCIYAGKEEIRLLALIDPGRVDEIERLEHAAADVRRLRNLETPGRYQDESPTFFESGRNGACGIREVVTWARTKRGGYQLPLIDPPPKGGCFGWGGLCERGDSSE